MREADFRHLKPINDLLLVLLLLRHGYNDKTRRRLMTPLGAKPYIEIGVYSSGYTKDEYSGSTYYPVSEALTATLRQGQYVEGQKHWGYTDERELLLRPHEGIYNEEVRLKSEFTEEVRQFLLLEHPDLPLSDPSEWQLRQGIDLEITIVGYCFVSLQVYALRTDDGVERVSVHRANDKLLLWKHKF